MKQKNKTRQKGTDLAKLFAKAKMEASLESKLHKVETALSGVNLDSLANDNSNDETFALIADTQQEESIQYFTGVSSVVWNCPPKVFRVNVPTVFTNDDFDENPLGNLPTKSASIAYAKRIEDHKIAEHEKEVNFKQYLEDQQESIIAKNRAIRGTMLRNMRERMKEDITSKNSLKSQWEEERRKQIVSLQQQQQREQKEKEEAHLREEYRIRQIKEVKKAMEDKQARDYALSLEREKHIISKIVDHAEAREIIRRNQEEARMKYLEERRRKVEQKEIDEELNKLKNEEEKKLKFKESVDRMQGRVRMGNFLWHDGTLGFYDSVRKAPVDYIQYEDSFGSSYYYDPVCKSYQYREPTDAPVRHYTDYEREQYDAVHGEGAYDTHQASIAFKDGVNRDGGYWDEKGQWIKVNGYYDANYNWVDYEGFYDENGKYKKFAKVKGDLSFMV